MAIPRRTAKSRMPPNDESSVERTARCERLLEGLQQEFDGDGSPTGKTIDLSDEDRALLHWLCSLIIKWDQEDQDLIEKLKKRVAQMDLPEVTQMMGRLALSKLRLASDLTQWKGLFSEVAKYIVVKPKAVDDAGGPDVADVLAHAGVESVRPRPPK